MIGGYPELRRALDALLPEERADWLVAHLADQPEHRRKFAWHLAHDLVHRDAELLRIVATRLLGEGPSRSHAILALARLHNRLEEFSALRELILGTLDEAPEPRADWLRALLRVELLSPSPGSGRLWSMALAEQPRLALQTLRFLRGLRRHGTADPTPLLAYLERHMARIAQRGLPPALQRLAAAGSIALVGNGSRLKGSAAGAAIEAHEVVVRMNYPHLSGHEADTGRRTDLMLFHDTKRPVLDELTAREPEFRGLPAFGVRGAVLPGKVNPPRMPDLLVGMVREITNGTPTTGLFAIVLAALLFRRPVTLFGFDFFAPGRPGHYFGDTVAAAMHEVAYERWFGTYALPILCPELRRDAASG